MDNLLTFASDLCGGENVVDIVKSVNHYCRIISQVRLLTLQIDVINANLLQAVQTGDQIACYRIHLQLSVLEGVRDLYTKYAGEVATKIATRSQQPSPTPDYADEYRVETTGKSLHPSPTPDYSPHWSGMEGGVWRKIGIQDLMGVDRAEEEMSTHMDNLTLFLDDLVEA